MNEKIESYNKFFDFNDKLIKAPVVLPVSLRRTSLYNGAVTINEKVGKGYFVRTDSLRGVDLIDKHTNEIIKRSVPVINICTVDGRDLGMMYAGFFFDNIEGF